MTTGKTLERIPVILRSRKTAQGDRKLVLSECQEYLILDRVGERISVQVRDSKAEAVKEFEKEIA